MNSQVESDFELAQRLHREMNEPNGDIIELSDSEDETKVKISSLPLQAVRDEVCFDNQQAITIKREKTSNDDFFMPSMGTYLNLSTNAEWSEVNMASNLQQIFDKLKTSFFSPWLNEVKYTIKWDKTCVISDGSSFKIFESHREVLVRTSGMVHPRIQLISVVLHILIHLYLNTSSKGSVKISLHDENFREIMLFLNETLHTSISTFHKFHYSSEDNEYCGHWYQCTGICLNYEPYHGTVRCTSIPSSSHSFWAQHEDSCGGQFFKIFEITRFNLETQECEKKYVRNVRYMFPKPLCDDSSKKGHPKTKIQPRELFDLTDEAEAKVQNLCEVVNLDDSEFNCDQGATEVQEVVQRFIKQNAAIFAKCPFCEQIVGSLRFQSHIDSCRGFQKKVIFSATTRISKIFTK